MSERAAIAVAIECAGWARTLPDAALLAEKAARAALRAARRDGAALPRGLELGVTLSDARHLRALNRDWRRKDAPTNVLAFPAYAPAELARLAGPGRRVGPAAIGDVIIAYEVVREEAAAQGKRVRDHLAHLAIHGTLHLLGYDHARASDARRMEALEIAVLAGLGMGDPYRAPRARGNGAARVPRLRAGGKRRPNG
ncbi:MAG TPA: rRNA maturation RNase YbeY [Alphaproteobacteria bacterium]|nr:rRNA maturation RNase YbeY [Alphaproteobacteria bacterium]